MHWGQPVGSGRRGLGSPHAETPCTHPPHPEAQFPVPPSPQGWPPDPVSRPGPGQGRLSSSPQRPIGAIRDPGQGRLRDARVRRAHLGSLFLPQRGGAGRAGLPSRPQAKRCPLKSSPSRGLRIRRPGDRTLSPRTLEGHPTQDTHLTRVGHTSVMGHESHTQDTHLTRIEHVPGTGHTSHTQDTCLTCIEHTSDTGHASHTGHTSHAHRTHISHA